MGFGMTLEKFLWHLFSEPAAAVQGLTHSIKDITEILYFYFTELSLTACYVILFIIAARYLLRNAPKRYSYALWGIVYFKLVSVLKLDFFKHSFIPQPQIDKIYYDITPDYTAFYSTEAGIVSQVQSEFVTPVPVVTPIYTPALIWFVVLCILVVVSALIYFSAYSKLKNSSLENVDGNVYISDAISTPFVFGIIRPKIYLPYNLSAQQQNYVVTHEKVHIRRGDHIIKLFAFAITCIHWFNPLVWLSFFLLEKDMEMSCDEKVLQILGNEHKKDYSYCILSLASNRKFVPKAYLSFGDSDTKKRIKNVLNYKKPAVIATVMTVIGVVVIAVGMLADSGVVYVPGADESTTRMVQINFPVYDQRTEYNGDIFDKSFALLMNLPSDWSVSIPEESDVAYPLVGAWNRMGIYDKNGKLVGAIGYNIYDITQTEPMAIYNQIALGNHYQFAVGGEEYYDTVTADTFVTSTMSVYTSANMAQQLGLGDKEIINHGVLCRNSELGVYVAIEIDKNVMDDSELNNFSHSVFITEPVVSNPFDSSYDRFNFSMEGYNTDLSFILPYGWTMERRYPQVDTYPEYLTLDDDFGDVFDIYDSDKNNVGAFGFISYTEYMGNENKLMAIYGAVALPNMYHFDVTENYLAVNSDADGLWESGITKVYHSPQLNRDIGLKEETTYGDGILSYSRECTCFVAFEFKENLFDTKELTAIAQSISINPANSVYGVAYVLLNKHYRNIETYDNFDISEIVSEDVLDLLNAKKEIAKHRQQIFGMDKQSYSVSVVPYDKENWIDTPTHKEIKVQVVRTWRYNTANFDSSSSDIVSLHIDSNGEGLLIVTKYQTEEDQTYSDMDADYWKAVKNGNEKKFLTEFVREYKSFLNNIDSSANMEIDWTFAHSASRAEIAKFVTDNDYIDVLYSIAKQYGYSTAQVKTLYENLSWDYINSEFRIDGNDEHIKQVYDRIILGLSEKEVNAWVVEQLLVQGFSEDNIKTLVHRSWAPIELYFMTDAKAHAFITKLLDPNADSDYVVNRWDLSTSCAKESTEDTYIITYCDEKITCSTGLLSLDNTNSFDIIVHLLSTGNNELKIDIPAGTTSALSVNSVKTEFTVGIHADVAADTDIMLIVREVKTE